MKNTLLISVLGAVVVGGAVGFFGGMQYQKSQVPAAAPGQFNRRNNQSGAGAVRGQILSVADATMTVKLADGSSKIVLLSTTTAINEATTAAKSALQTGKQVMVIGSTNSDGSVTAQNISLGTFGGGRPAGQ